MQDSPLDHINALINAQPPEEQAPLLQAIVTNHLQKLLPAERKALLRKMVSENWPQLPSYSTLSSGPIIEELQKATVGTGLVMVFKDKGITKAVVLNAGSHYEGLRYNADPAHPVYMIPGGFINLTETPGSASVPANSKQADSPRQGNIRELEEEIIDDKNRPVLSIDPKRLKPMDTQSLTFPSGERRVVIGFMVELTADEANIIKQHVAKLNNDPIYRRTVRAHTINGESGKPESCKVSILPLAEIVADKHTLLHPDQKSLFTAIHKDMLSRTPNGWHIPDYRNKQHSR